MLQLADVCGGWPQVPKGPTVMLQTPPQQSAGWLHTSPTWPQKDDGEQTPPAQSCEQQSPFKLQVSPRTRHMLMGVHVPPVPQMPLQHCEPLEQGWLSDVHDGLVQTPVVQTPVQQSLGPVQA